MKEWALVTPSALTMGRKEGKVHLKKGASEVTVCGKKLMHPTGVVASGLDLEAALGGKNLCKDCKRKARV